MQRLRGPSSSRSKLQSKNPPRIWDNGINYLSGLWRQEKVPNSEGKAFEKKQLKRLQSRSRRTDATVWMGKEGASEEITQHIVNQLKTRHLVKVKIQKSALEDTKTANLAEQVAASTSSTLVDVMGHTFTLYKRKEPNRDERGR